MEFYQIKKDLIQAIASVLYERPYKEVFGIVDALRATTEEQEKKDKWTKTQEPKEKP